MVERRGRPSDHLFDTKSVCNKIMFLLLEAKQKYYSTMKRRVLKIFTAIFVEKINKPNINMKDPK
jgi:hypothetical protein